MLLERDVLIGCLPRSIPFVDSWRPIRVESVEAGWQSGRQLRLRPSLSVARSGPLKNHGRAVQARERRRGGRRRREAAVQAAVVDHLRGLARRNRHARFPRGPDRLQQVRFRPALLRRPRQAVPGQARAGTPHARHQRERPALHLLDPGRALRRPRPAQVAQVPLPVPDPEGRPAQGFVVPQGRRVELRRPEPGHGALCQPRARATVVETRRGRKGTEDSVGGEDGQGVVHLRGLGAVLAVHLAPHHAPALALQVDPQAPPLPHQPHGHRQLLRHPVRVHLPEHPGDRRRVPAAHPPEHHVVLWRVPQLGDRDLALWLRDPLRHQRAAAQLPPQDVRGPVRAPQRHADHGHDLRHRGRILPVALGVAQDAPLAVEHPARRCQGRGGGKGAQHRGRGQGRGASDLSQGGGGLSGPGFGPRKCRPGYRAYIGNCLHHPRGQ